MKHLLNLIITASIASVCSISTFAQTGSLDGNSYQIEVKQQTGKKHRPKGGWPTDTLTFDSGEMFSLYMQERERFLPISYSEDTDTGDLETGISFKYENTNRGGSLLRIEGTVIGDTIKGTIRWTAAHKTRTRTYTFEGTLIVS